MEIIYLWIGQYANIYDKGFNFSNKFHVVFKEKQIYISFKEGYIENFYHENIISITAIAGENGSGKTNLLAFFENFFIQDGFAIYGNCFVVLYNKESKLFFVCKKDIEISEQVSCPEGYSVNIINGFTTIKDTIFPILYTSGIEIQKRYPIQSNLLELSGQKYLEDCIELNNKEIDKQISKLNDDLVNDTIELVNNENYESLKKNILRHSSPLYHYKNNEVKIQIEFICKQSITDFDFIPRFVEVYFNPFFFRENYEVFAKDPLYEKLSKAIYDPEFTPSSDAALAKNRFKKAIVASIYFYLINYEKNIGLFHSFKIEDIHAMVEENDSKETILDKIIDFICINEFRFSGGLVDFENLKAFVENIDSVLDKFNVRSFTRDRYILERNEGTYEFLNFFFTFWTAADFLFIFELTELSAGQKAMLNLLSRIYYSRYFVEIYRKNSILLLIDEGELYLHPEWQRRFLDDIISYIPKFYKDKEIQIILSTHSPYVLSDILLDHTILLQRKNGVCDIVDYDSFPQTFGSNIHEILAHSFFMEKGTIGEFSKNKINSLFRFLHNDAEKTEEWSFDDAWNVIKIIGDENLKQHLIGLFNNKKEQIEGEEYYEPQINRMKDEILRLERMQKLRKILEDKKRTKND